MFFGFIILLFGILYLISAIHPDLVLNFQLIWPSLFIIFSIYTIVKERCIRLYSSIILFIGTLYLLLNAKIIDHSYFKILWPGMIILIGLSLIFNSSKFRKNRIYSITNTKEAIVNYHGVFAFVQENVKNKNYQGANIYAVFGGVELDLKEIEFKEKSIVLNVYSVFGGTTLFLPEEYNIVLNFSAFFGGNDNKTKTKYKEGNQTIYVNCISVFGGTELK